MQTTRRDRDRLIELLKNADNDKNLKWYDLYDLCTEKGCAEYFADYLLANGVTVQEWISVEDRLPKESGMYIVTANDGHAQRVSFVIWQKRNKAWNLTGARSYWRVTHWRPMPQPPKGE